MAYEEETRRLYPGAADRGTRLDAYLAERLDGISRSAAVRLIEEGHVLADGRRAAKSFRLTGEETVEVTLPPPEPTEALPENIPLSIVYEDDDVIVVDKPKGLLVHPAPGHPDGTLVNALLYHCAGSLSGIGGTLRPGIVHRIDRDTTGLLIAAKNDFAHQKLSEQLKDHSLSRTYRCLVTGTMRAESGTVNAPIGRSTKDRKKMAVVSPGSGREAVTHWRVVEHLRGADDVECRRETGRTHQIRVHMAHIGHPVIGDPVYGRVAPGLTGQCLHAIGLRFLHPRTGEAVELRCPLPEEYVRERDKLRGRG